MGLLDKLWDDTVAGPQPESGLGRLRKCATVSERSGISAEAEEALRRIRERRSSAEFDRTNEEIGQVTRSITIVKPPYLRSLSVDNTDIASSPTAASPPISPSPLTPREGESSWRTPKGTLRKIGSERREKAEPRSPTVYDWVVISALDR